MMILSASSALATPVIPPPRCEGVEECRLVSHQTVILSDSQTYANGRPAVEVWDDHTAWYGTEDEFFAAAQWIGASFYAPHPQIGGLTTYTRTFNIVGNPTDGALLIGADNSYQTWLNGQWIGGDMGEVNFTPNTIDSWNMTPALREGQNTLKIVVKNFPQPGGNVRSNPTGLIYEGVININSEDCAPATVPEPSTYAMIGLGLAGIAFRRRQ